MQSVLSRIRLLAVYVLLLMPFIVYGAIQALQSSNSSPIDWVDSSFSERRHYDEFVELFGPGDAVVASWPECYWEDERLDTLINGLRESQTFRAADGSPLFHQVVSGREALLGMAGPEETTYTTAPGEGPAQSTESLESSEVLAPELTSKQSSMPLNLVIQRLQGTLIGKDGRTTCLIVTLNSAGLAVRASLVENLRKAIRVCCDVADQDIHMVGPVIDGLTVDEASHKSLTKFAAPSAIVIFVICWWSLKSVLFGAIVFLTACFCQAVLLSVIYYSGERLSALLIILPPLVQVLTVSGGIHLMNYYLNAAKTLPPNEAAVEAFRQGWLPSVLSLGTTAMGTASLMISGLEPIRLFGIYGTIGVLLTIATVLTVIPCSMIILGRKGSQRRLTEPSSFDVNDKRMPAASGNPETPSEIVNLWYRLASWLNRRNGLSLIVLFGIMFSGAAGLPRLKTSIRIETLFAAGSRIMQDYRWLEDKLGPLVPIEVLVTFDDECRLNDRRRMDLLWRVNNAILKHENVRSTSSALTVFPPMPAMKSLPVNMRSAMLNKGISLAKPAFRQMGTLRENKDGEVWRVTARVSALEPLDYGEILRGVRATIDAELKADGNSLTGVSISTSGIMPLVHQIQGQLLSDLFKSLMSALVVITITMTIVEAGLVRGIIAMASNVFPIIIAFGWMGWFQHSMDIGSVMTASVALGIAVDDTLHFLAFFRRMISRPGATRFSAVLSAYQHCGAAMIQTSVSCGLGLLVFALSDFVPTGRFAILMAFLLMLALLGDLLLLPALLLSPAGRLFEPERQSSKQQGENL